jgi:hypothetical protein
MAKLKTTNCNKLAHGHANTTITCESGLVLSNLFDIYQGRQDHKGIRFCEGSCTAYTISARGVTCGQA